MVSVVNLNKEITISLSVQTAFKKIKTISLWNRIKNMQSLPEQQAE